MKSKFLLTVFVFIVISMSSVAQKTGSFTDSRDRKVYKTVNIGTQTWMAENLAYKANSGCWAYKNDVSNVATYGYLYNWETAKDGCPTNWHLPSDAEWTTLTNYLGGEGVAGGKLKSINGWNSPNTDATNSSSFTALPGGSRDINGAFDGVGITGHWWSSAESDIFEASRWYLSYIDSGLMKYGDDESNGFSVRCVKD